MHCYHINFGKCKVLDTLKKASVVVLNDMGIQLLLDNWKAEEKTME